MPAFVRSAREALKTLELPPHSGEGEPMRAFLRAL
jgi:hypothetical protein